MAAITPSNIYTESSGSLTNIIAKFTTVTGSDTWTSGIPGILYASANQGDSAILNTVTNYGIGVSWTAAGVLTFRSSTETNTSLYCSILTKSC